MMLLDDALGMAPTQKKPAAQTAAGATPATGLIGTLKPPGIATTGTAQQPMAPNGLPAPTTLPTNTPAAPGTFSATDNLINKQFTSAPTASPGYQAVSGPDYSQTNDILSKLIGGGGFSSGPGPQSFSWDADTNKVKGLTMQSLESALQGPDRAKLASDAYGILEERSRPEFDQRVRQLGQNTAALGRVGSGIYGSNLTDLNAERERELGFNRRELANTSAGQSLADQLSQLDAARGVLGEFAGMDRVRGNLDAQAASGYGAGRGADFDRNLQLADFASSLADRQYGANVRERDTEYGAGRDQYGDAVGERGYQYGLEGDARDDAYRKRGFEEDLTNSAFDRDVRTRSLEDELYGNEFNRGLDLFNVGSREGVTGQLNNQAGRYDQQSADAGDAFAEAMAAYGMRKQGAPAPSSPSQDFYRRVGVMPDEALAIPNPTLANTRQPIPRISTRG